MAKKTLKANPLLMPLPAAVVTVASPDGDNPITISWIGVLCSEPPTIGFSVRESRHSFGILEKAEDFVVNIPWEKNVRAVDICGRVSGRNKDKWELCGITRLKSQKVKTPGIEEFPINLECVLKERKELGSHTLYIGEIVNVTADEELFLSNGKVDVDSIRPLGYIPQTGIYYGTGRIVERAGFSLKEL